MNKQNLIHNILKYLDPVLVFLLLFLSFLMLLIYNLEQINEKVKSHGKYQNIINDIKVLDIEFDSFVSSRATLLNYDPIVEKVNKTYQLINKLDDGIIVQEYSNNFNSTLRLLKKNWSEKHTHIERFKSINSSIIGSLNYIIEFTKTIKLNNLKNNTADIFILDNAITTLFQIFINIELDEQTIQKDIRNISYLSAKYKNSDFDFLMMKYNSTLEDVLRLNNIQSDYYNIDLKNILNNLENSLLKEYKENLQKQEKIALSFFIVSSILLFVIVLSYIRTNIIKKELISFKYAVENSDNSIVMTDKNRKITYVNDAFEKVTGYTREEALGQDPKILKSGKLPSEFYKGMNETLDRGEKWTGEFVNVNKNGELYYETASITPIIKDDEITGYLAIKLNVTDYVRQQEKVEFLAYHDSLTLLPNRRSLEEIITTLIENAKREKSTFAILFLDLDGFKMINDALGHDIGDLLLKALTKRFQQGLKDSDKIFRIGGDEFAIILDYDDLLGTSVIENIATRIIKVINQPILIKEHSLHVGCSIGIALYPQDGIDLLTLLKHSDTAMYKAKQDGKNRFHFYDESLSSSVHSRLNIEQALSKALDNNEFHLVYQPKYDMKNQTIVSFEALIRWDNNALGRIEPSIFIGIAEETGIINKIGLFVFEQACYDFNQLKEANQKLEMITINVSSFQLAAQNFVEQIINITDKLEISPAHIGIEITETHIMKNIKEIQNVLNKLREYGFVIIIDDFGTGYSSMSYLQKLPIDILKIDKSFVDELKDNQNNTAIIKAIVAISKSFGYKTVAEGIETKEQEEILQNLGVDLGQGYLFAKPQQIDYFTKS